MWTRTREQCITQTLEGKRCDDNPSVRLVPQLCRLLDLPDIRRAGCVGDRLCIHVCRAVRVSSSFARIHPVCSLRVVLPNDLAEWACGIGANGESQSRGDSGSAPSRVNLLDHSFSVPFLSCSAGCFTRIIQPDSFLWAAVVQATYASLSYRGAGA